MERKKEKLAGNGVSSISRSACHMPSASAGQYTTLPHFSHDSPVIRWHNEVSTTTFNNNKGCAPKFVINDRKLMLNGWNLSLKRKYALPQTHNEYPMELGLIRNGMK